MKNNPFRMLGSYIGLILGVIPGYFSFAIVLALAESGKFRPIALAIPFGVLFVSFLIGWAIHILIRIFLRKSNIFFTKTKDLNT